MTLPDLFSYIKVELQKNSLIKSKIIIVFFRGVSYLQSKNKFIRLMSMPIFVLYKLIIDWTLGVEIPIKANIGKGFVLYHGFGLVINAEATIGENVILRQGVTIGNKILQNGEVSNCPIIGDNVEVGANASVIGGVSIGDNSVIGVNAVVIKNVPKNSIAIGVPAKNVNKSSSRACK